MKLNYLQTIAITSLALAMTTIGCSKSGGSSNQPAAADVFVGNWQDNAGSTLTIDTPDSRVMPPGYTYRITYNIPGMMAPTIEPCKLTDASTLLCMPGSSLSDSLVYSSANSTLALTIQIPQPQTIIFHK